MTGRRFVLLAVFVCLVFTAACGGPSTSTSGQSTSPPASQNTGAGDRPVVSVDAAAATRLAVEFVKKYGEFSPAWPGDPGDTWVRSWKSMAVHAAVDSATDRFDQLWGWTWDQSVQTQSVLPTADPTVTDSGFGSVVVTISARRYIIGLFAQSPKDGTWQDLVFSVTIAPRDPHSTRSDLAVYQVGMRPRGA